MQTASQIAQMSHIDKTGQFHQKPESKKASHTNLITHLLPHTHIYIQHKNLLLTH